MTYNMPYAHRLVNTPRPRCATCGKACFHTTRDAQAFVAHMRRADPRGATRMYWYHCGRAIHITRASMNYLGEQNAELLVRLW